MIQRERLRLAPGSEHTFVHDRGEALRHAVVAGVRVAYRWIPGREPGRTPVVAIHGLGSSLLDLTGVAEAAGAPTLLLDLPGFGRSERPDRPFTPERAARTVVGVLDVVGLRRPVWLGCSYGGHVALRAALDVPARVAGLVLVSSGGLDPDPPAALAAVFAEHALAGRTLEQVSASCDALSVVVNPATRAFRARRLAEHVSGESDYRAVSRSARGALEDTAPRCLEDVRVPVEVLLGAADPLLPVAVARAAFERFGRATLTVLDGVGHMPWLEAPLEVSACLRRMSARKE